MYIHLRNGRRLKHASERVERSIEAFRQGAKDLTLDDCEGDGVLFRIIWTSLQQAASLLELRFKYLKVAPWCFCNADSVSGATRFLASATSRPLEQQDCLTQYLYYTYEDDLKEVVASGECSLNLQDEVGVVNETPLDESAGEGYHRGTHCTRIRARSSTIAYVKMSTRMDQSVKHMKYFIRRGEAGKRVVRYEWQNWSRVLQSKWKNLWRRKHWPKKKVFERGYRMDEFSEHNWSSVATPIPAPGQGPPLVAIIAENRVMRRLGYGSSISRTCSVPRIGTKFQSLSLQWTMMELRWPAMKSDTSSC